MPLFKRGMVFRIKFVPPSDPQKQIDKFAVCLQEGKIIDKSADIVAALITTQNLDNIYPWEVFLSATESNSPTGAKVQCNKIHTFPKDWIEGYAYTLSEATMKQIDLGLMLGIGIRKLEDIAQVS